MDELKIIKRVFEELRAAIAKSTQDVMTEYIDYGKSLTDTKYKTVISTEIILSELDRIIEKYEFAINERKGDVVSVPELN